MKGKHKLTKWAKVFLAILMVFFAIGVRFQATVGASAPPDFGDGADGDLVVGIGQTVFTDNTRTAVSTTANAGQNTVSVQSTSGFAGGDEVLVIQMQGSGAGAYEFRTITSVNGNTLTLQDNLDNTYTVGGNSKAQIIQVPHYQNVTVQGGGILTAHAWDGTSGGIVAFRANGIVMVQTGSTIDVAGRGYIGGAGGQSGGTGKQGETYSGLGGTSTNRNNGGGGGGLGSNDADGADGGGGGGYAGSGANGTSGAGGGPHIPGQGGIGYGSQSLNNEIYFGSGGGGGGGYHVNSLQINGGNGGGIIIIYGNDLQINGTVKANGENGDSNPDPVGSRRNGVGGGGAGGSIYIVTRGGALGTSRIQALGGTGGVPGSEGGTGGNGGEGRIRIEFCDSLTGSTSPSASTEQLTCVPSNQPPVAVAGTSLDTNNRLELNGSLSTDPDGTIVSYSWQIAGETGPRTGQIVSMADLPAGEYTVELTVSDDQGATSIDTMLFGVPAAGDDTIPPARPNVQINENPVGADDTISGNPGDVEGLTTIDVFSDAGLTTVVGSTTANSDGSFAPISIGDNAFAVVFVTASDGAANQSLAQEIENDIVAPTVEITSPADGETDVRRNTKITITFSELMDVYTTTNAFSISPLVNGTIRVEGKRLTFAPDEGLDTNTTFTVTIDAGAADKAGNPLSASFSFTFTTTQ